MRKAMITLPLVHFNDAYTLRHRDFDVSHFAGTIDTIRETWPKKKGKPDGRFLFSGDVGYCPGSDTSKYISNYSTRYLGHRWNPRSPGESIW